MSIAPNAAGFHETVVRPAVYVGTARRLLDEELARALTAATVDLATGLPGMFTLTFDDQGRGDRLFQVLAVGTEVAVGAASPVRPTEPRMLLTGEVTALEAEYGERAWFTVRGYTEDHRLQRVRRSTTYLRMSDDEIARTVARRHGLTLGEIARTPVVHEHVGQADQTDWEFLTARARALGYRWGMAHGRFFFRSESPTGSTLPLVLGGELVSFSPRVTAGNVAPEAEIRLWDPLAAKVVSEQVRLPAGDTNVGLTPARAAAAAAGRPGPGRSGPATGPQGTYGPAPSPRAEIGTATRSLAGTPTPAFARAQAQGLAEAQSATVAEASGLCLGHPWLAPGRAVDVGGVAEPFAGRWLITRARHEFDQGVYRTWFEVSGSHDRSLLGLTGGGRTTNRLPGVGCGIVTDVNDPRNKGRVRLVLPWLSPEYETDWACVAQPGAGQDAGFSWLPEPGDEVMVGFEYGDPGRPYVLGAVLNDRSRFTVGGPAVKVAGRTAAVQWRGLVAPSGGRLGFHDSEAGGRVDRAEIVLGSGDGTSGLQVDQTGAAVVLRAGPGRVAKPAEKGRVTVEVGPGGAVEIRAGAGGSVTVDGGAQLNLKAQWVNLEGTQVTVNGTGPVEVKGKPIKLN